MSKYILQTVCNFTLEVKSKRVDGIKKYRACYQEQNKISWHPIAGSRWEVKSGCPKIPGQIRQERGHSQTGKGILKGVKG